MLPNGQVFLVKASVFPDNVELGDFYNISFPNPRTSPLNRGRCAPVQFFFCHCHVSFQISTSMLRLMPSTSAVRRLPSRGRKFAFQFKANENLWAPTLHRSFD
jgi:hypothetical protein